MNKVTASGSGRLLQCAGHVRLPWVRENSAAASEGTRLHAIMETMQGNPIESKAMKAEPLALAAWVELAHKLLSMGLEPVRVEHEVAYVLDTATRTARRLTLTGPREYGVTQWHEMPGTIDAIVWCSHVETGEEIPFVIDWKFGMEPVRPDSAQLRTLAAAFMLSSAEPLDMVHTGIAQSNEAGAHFDFRGYSRDDLMAHVELLGDALNETHEGRVVLSRGPECRYCPALGSCPSQLAAMSVIVSPGGPGPITPERAGAIWSELKQAKKRLEAIEDACKALAAEGDGLPLPGGKRLTVVQRSRTSMDAKALEAIARGHGASDDEINACSKTTTYTTTQEIKA